MLTIINRPTSLCDGFSRREAMRLGRHANDHSRTAAAAAQLVPGKPQLGRRVLRRKDGSTFPIELSLSLIESGDRQFLLGIARDITHHERARLAQEEAQTCGKEAGALIQQARGRGVDHR